MKLLILILLTQLLIFSCSDDAVSVDDTPTAEDTIAAPLELFPVGERYLGVYTESLDSIIAEKYGVTTTISGVEQTLYFDMFQPKNDTALSRPLIIMAVGGGFVYTSRVLGHSIATSLSQCGYVTAIIDYRVYDGVEKPVKVNSLELSAALAVDDMRSAISYFKANASTYNIDTNSIFLMGHSAGAITSLYAGLADSANDFPVGSQAVADTIGEYSSVAGVVSLAGAVSSLSILKGNSTPIFMAHSVNDNVIPIDSGLSGLPFVTEKVYQYGSRSMFAALDTTTIKSKLIVIEGGDHSSIVLGDGIKDYSKELLEFLYSNKK